MRWWLDLQSLAPGGEGVRFGLTREVPGWAWLLAVLGAMSVSGVVYARLLGPRWARLVLAGVRATLLVYLFLLFAGPRLVQRTESTEPDWVMMLVDRSASLTVADLGTSGARLTREDQLGDALSASADAVARLGEDKSIHWIGFDAGVSDLGAGESGVVPSLAAPTGVRTRLGQALDEALRRAAARPLASIVIFSDGRSSDAISESARRRLMGERVPVHVVPLGLAEPPMDLAVADLSAPAATNRGDLVPVRAVIERRSGPNAPSRALVELVDEQTGRVLASDRVELDADRPDAAVTLVGEPEDEGELSWALRVTPEGEDLVPDNNTRSFAVRVSSEPLRVLYLDGTPRWEQRYLRNLLLRERSITSSALLLAPDRLFTQEGDVELAQLPRSPEDWSAFDVVILGDLTPTLLSEEQLQQLAEHVSLGGAGVLWIAGPNRMPDRWFGTPVEDLLPMLQGRGTIARLIGASVLVPTLAAEREGVLRLSDEPGRSWPDELSDPATGWSRLYYVQELAPPTLKPASEVLANAVDIETGDRSPAVISMRYGAGLSIYVASDEIWRYRFGRGEVLYERFWVQLVRRLARARLAAGNAALALTASPERADVGAPVQLGLRAFDQSLIESLGDRPVVLARRADDEGSGAAEVTLTRDAGSPTWSGVWVADTPGRWLIEAPLAGVLLEDERPRTEVRAVLPDDELSRPEADHELLRALADETGGRVLTASDLGDLSSLVPNRARTLVDERTEPLWDTPLALLIGLMLLTTEWVGRRVIRLL